LPQFSYGNALAITFDLKVTSCKLHSCLDSWRDLRVPAGSRRGPRRRAFTPGERTNTRQIADVTSTPLACTGCRSCCDSPCGLSYLRHRAGAFSQRDTRNGSGLASLLELRWSDAPDHGLVESVCDRGLDCSERRPSNVDRHAGVGNAG
jgi:hypothetical protein